MTSGTLTNNKTSTQPARKPCTTMASWAIGLLLLIGIGNATRVQRLSLSEIRDQANSIIIARVTSQETRLGPNAKMVWTDYQIEVEEVLQGVNPTTLTTLSFAGGETAGKSVGIAGVPRLQVGGRYVFFLLHGQTPWATPTVGWGQGIFEIVPQQSFSEPEVLVSYDGEPLEISPGGLRRGDLVRRNDRWIEIPEATDGLSGLDRLLQQRENVPVVLNPDGKPIDQSPDTLGAEAKRLDQRSFASLDQLRGFIRGEVQQDPGAQR